MLFLGVQVRLDQLREEVRLHVDDLQGQEPVFRGGSDGFDGLSVLLIAGQHRQLRVGVREGGHRVEVPEDVFEFLHRGISHNQEDGAAIVDEGATMLLKDNAPVFDADNFPLCDLIETVVELFGEVGEVGGKHFVNGVAVQSASSDQTVHHEGMQHIVFP